MANGLTKWQEKFGHYFGIFAGVASITGLVLGIRALMKEKEYERKFGILAPMLEEQGLGAAPNYQTTQQVDNPSVRKRKEKLYHALIRYYLCDDYTANKTLYDGVKKKSPKFSVYCTLPSHRISWSFPPIDKRGLPKKDARYIKKWADKHMAWKPD